MPVTRKILITCNEAIASSVEVLILGDFDTEERKRVAKALRIALLSEVGDPVRLTEIASPQPGSGLHVSGPHPRAVHDAVARVFDALSWISGQAGGRYVAVGEW